MNRLLLGKRTPEAEGTARPEASGMEKQKVGWENVLTQHTAGFCLGDPGQHAPAAVSYSRSCALLTTPVQKHLLRLPRDE